MPKSSILRWARMEAYGCRKSHAPHPALPALRGGRVGRRRPRRRKWRRSSARTHPFGIRPLRAALVARGRADHGQLACCGPSVAAAAARHGIVYANGALNRRAKREGVLAEIQPPLTGAPGANVKRMLASPAVSTFLDRLPEPLAAWPIEAEVRQAVVEAEGILRRPELRRRPTGGRSTGNHLDLKRLYWNCRTLRTGQRRNQSPYQRLGLILPNRRWWELLNLTPEHLRSELSALRIAV